jgi:DNA-binding protein HU-beta
MTRPRRCEPINKADLIEQIAQAAEISKSAAERAIDALVGAIKSSLRKDETVTLVGFGTFYAGKRAARTGRNPRTGAALDIKAARLPKFRAGKALKDAIN